MRLQFTVTVHGFRAVVLAVILCLVASVAHAQAVAEYGHITTGTSAVKQIPLAPPLAPPAETKSSSPHITASSAEPPEIVNRRAMEQSAGENAAILILQSAPQGAAVWIDGKAVGKSPLTIKLAPGNHEIEIEGAQTDVVKQKIVVVALEKREVVINLAPRFRTQIRLR